MRDALVAGLTLDTFNRHADKVAMANVAQLINCIQSLFLADEDQFLVTPAYHVFAMYAGAPGRPLASAPRVSAPPVPWTDDGRKRPQALWGLNGSASARGNTVTLTVTNSSLTEPRETEIAVRGGASGAVRCARPRSRAQRARCQQLRAPRDREAVARHATSRSGGSPLVYTFPPASVTKLEIALA